MDEQNTPERRQHKRIEKHFILKYHDLNQPDVTYSASQLRNISLGGICFVTERPFPPGTRMGIELKTPFCSQLTELTGTVLESQEKIPGIIFLTRFQFDQVNPQTEEILKQAIEFFEHESEHHDD
ncbi:MAG: PilZ domain-containing protein [Candidatus Omnitrophota bacterium]